LFDQEDAMEAATLNRTKVGDLTLAYREAGTGPPLLLLHGWPTSSFLWRDVIPALARSHRVLALDLPGFGGSDKPEGARYTFGYFEDAIDRFLAAVGADDIALAAHDIGGPVGLHWALRRPGRVQRLALLNTLVFPEFSDVVIEFVQALTTPGRREELTSPEGLEAILRLGLADDAHATPEAIAGIQEPFGTDAARRSLAHAGIGLEPGVFYELARDLPKLDIPLRLIYGEQDRILPDVAETMARLKAAVPDAELTALPHCGHFLQEDAPEEVGDLLARFFA
jgi:pimeloyl-ACP methyl ester carboxylesterase